MTGTDLRFVDHKLFINKNFYSIFQREGFTQKVFSDVLGKAFQPTVHLKIQYNNELVYLGNHLPTELCQERPVVELGVSDPNTFWTLLLVDPDVPSNIDPNMKDWVHWLIGNIPGSNVSQGEIICDYIGIAPAQGTGDHRYVFLLLKQPEKITFNERKLDNKSLLHRDNFNTKKFIEKYNLSARGFAFFKSKWDSYVTNFYTQTYQTDEPIYALPPPPPKLPLQHSKYRWN